MDTARLLTQLPIIMGLSSAALLLIFIVSISTPFTTLCIYSSHYSFPAIKSMCVEYVCSMWSLLSRAADHSKEPIIITPRNIFLLVNLIIFFLFISMHLQQHAPAAGKRSSSRKKRQQQTEKLIMNDKKAATLVQSLEGPSLADYLAASAAAEAAMASEGLSISSACVAELRPLQASMESFENLQEESFNGELADEASIEKGSLQALTLTADSERINGPDVEQIVLDEDGRLRLIDGPISPKGSDAKKIEDGRLRLIESTNGSDAEKIVLDKDGRLRLIDRPLPSSSRPEKSLSDNYYPSDNNHNVNYDTPSLNNSNYDIHSLNNNNNDTYSLDNNLNYDTHSINNNNNNDTYSLDNHHDSLDNHSLNPNHSNLNEINNGSTLALDYNSNSSLSHQNLNHDDPAFTNKSSSLKRTLSRPIRVKKSDSLDATWTAINHTQLGSATNGNSRDHKHLIRQSSRKDFKPSRGGRGVMTRDANNRVRREPSISQDELNAKVESFIAKFNEQIRIERQQSILSYMQMVDRGA